MINTPSLFKPSSFIGKRGQVVRVIAEYSALDPDEASLGRMLFKGYLRMMSNVASFDNL